MSMGDAALALAAEDFAVFRCGERKKTPLYGSHGFKDGTTDPATIREWWRERPNCNIACATGAVSKRFLLDPDGPIGEESLRQLEAEHAPLPRTRTVITGREDGGRHLYFKMPDGTDIGSGILRPKLDVKANGGYAVLPPSVHPSGAIYKWADNGATEFADPP
jgi:hypothetical protein